MEIKIKSKKMTVLYVLNMLRGATDEKRPVSQAAITRTLNGIGIECDRRTVARDIDCLNEIGKYLGFHVVKKKGGGCYYVNDEYKKEDCDDVINALKQSDVEVGRKAELIKKVKKSMGY